MSLEERFLAKVHKTDSALPCWEWTATCIGNGYGEFWMNGKNCYAHRVAYELWVGPIPANSVIDHLCRNTRYVNPAHLEAVTRLTNLVRGRMFTEGNLSKNECPYGHPYDLLNTDWKHKGRRCRTCHREGMRRAGST